MRERLTASGSTEEIQPSKEKGVHTFERRTVPSLLEGPNGEHAEVKLAISEQDGELRETNFWDLDKTLLIAEPIHGKAVEQIFPEYAMDEKSRKELHEVFFNGFALGNSFREWDRMWRIYGEEQIQYKDAAVYEHDFMNNPNQKVIDEAGHPEQYHERADEILQQYGEIAFGIMKKEYEKDPSGFQKKFTKPEMIQLLIEKTRLGQANVYMTANQRKFAEGLVAFSGLYEYGLALATDEDMAGGGKEIAIKNLIEDLGRMGLKVNKKRAAAIGDSIKGDVGSGAKAGLGSGVFITETSDDISSVLERAKGDSTDAEQIRSVLDNTEVEAIPTQEVTKSKHGIHRFGKRSSKNPK